MRILVVSDSHGNAMNLRQALLDQPAAQVVIHLGDGEADLRLLQRSFPEKTFCQVRGNCDWSSLLPPADTLQLDSPRGPVKLFFTHGHLYGVKDDLYRLICAAREQKADIALFGHTHQPLCDYEDGLYLLNPGALSGYQPTYGTIDITPQGIVTNVLRLQLK